MIFRGAKKYLYKKKVTLLDGKKFAFDIAFASISSFAAELVEMLSYTVSRDVSRLYLEASLVSTRSGLTILRHHMVKTSHFGVIRPLSCKARGWDNSLPKGTVPYPR